MLSQFVRDNSTLITGVAAFAALTAFFATQLKDVELQAILPGLTLLGAFLLAFELLTLTPAPPRHWRLAVFEMVLMMLVVYVGWYWLKTFAVMWVPLVGAVVNMFLLFAIPVVLTYVLGKTLTFVTVHVRHKQIADVTLIRTQRTAFFLFLVADAAVYFWAVHKLIPRPIAIHAPF